MFDKHRRWWAISLATLLSAAVAARTALAQPPGIDPQAEGLLQAATTYLAGQKRFTVHAQSTIEGVLDSGQKLEFDQAAVLSVQRPNKLRAERHGDLVEQVFYYDGQSLALFNPSEGYYATADAPATLEETLDFARETLGIIAPAGDLLYKNAFEILMQDVTSGFVVGKDVVGGMRCDHLAFRAPHVDWQIWIQEGDKPLPCKLVITSTDIAGSPQFTVTMNEWDLAPDLDDGAFAFTPSSDATQIEFLPRGAKRARSD